MPYGNHSFRAGSHLMRANPENYYLGSFTGDHINDEAFGKKIDAIVNKLSKIYGWGNFTCSWSPGVVKPIVTLSNEQKFKRATTKLYNLHVKRNLQIQNENSLFVKAYLNEEENKYYARIEILKIRYHQI